MLPVLTEVITGSLLLGLVVDLRGECWRKHGLGKSLRLWDEFSMVSCDSLDDLGGQRVVDCVIAYGAVGFYWIERIADGSALMVLGINTKSGFV